MQLSLVHWSKLKFKCHNFIHCIKIMMLIVLANASTSQSCSAVIPVAPPLSIETEISSQAYILIDVAIDEHGCIKLCNSTSECTRARKKDKQNTRREQRE